MLSEFNWFDLFSNSYWFWCFSLACCLHINHFEHFLICVRLFRCWCVWLEIDFQRLFKSSEWNYVYPFLGSVVCKSITSDHVQNVSTFFRCWLIWLINDFYSYVDFQNETCFDAFSLKLCLQIDHVRPFLDSLHSFRFW